MSDWQPIETAPVGEYVMFWGGAWRHAFAGRYVGGEHGEVWIDVPSPRAIEVPIYATHWMPLPAPPHGNDMRG